MNSRFAILRPLAAVGALVVIPFGAAAQSAGESDWNHFGVDFRLGLNMKTTFSNIGASTASLPPPAIGGVDHNYSDGFVRVDSSGDKGGVTWNWGYQNASQVPGNDTILMHTANVESSASTRNDDPHLGLEGTYERDLGHFSSGGAWGIKLAFGYTELDVHDTQPLNGNVSLITDAYPLGGITPPLAPYSGSFNGPGPVIGDTPTRSISTLQGAAQITGNRQVEAALYDFRLGPYVALPLFGQLSCQFSGGLAFGFANSTFSFSETTTTIAGATQVSGSEHHVESMVGFYGEAGLAYQIIPEASVFAGGQYQYLGDFTQTVAGRSAEVDLRHSVFFVVGLQWHF